MSDHHPGWYADPAQAGALRWWDGRTWTPFAMPRPGVAVAARLADERRLRPWAVVAVIVWVASLVGALAIYVHLGGEYRALYDWFRTVMRNAGTPGYVQPPLPHTSSAADISFLIYLPIVLYAVWLYRAAGTAQAIGYPSSRSPGLGAFSVLIPVVSWWMPAQSMRGCLPPGHHLRDRIPWVWGSYVVVRYLLGTTTVVVSAAISEDAGWVCLAVGFAIDVVFGVAAWSFVRAVGVDHEARAAAVAA